MTSIHLAKCTACGRVENIDLLDAGGPEFGKSHNALECIACYGPDWLPAMEITAHASACPDLAPAYRQFADSEQWLEGRANG